MYGQFQDQQNYQNQLFNYGGQNQYPNQQQSSGQNYLTPTEMRMYQQSHLSPMMQSQSPMLQSQGFQNMNPNYSQGIQAGAVYNSNRMYGQGETYTTPIEQRMYHQAGLQQQQQQPNISSMGLNQNYNQYNQALAQNFGQSSAQFGGQYNPYSQQQQQQQQQAGQVYNSNNLYGQGETYITPTEQRMFQNAGLGMNQLSQMGQMGQIGQFSHVNQLNQQQQQMNQNYSQNYSQPENKGQYYVTPSEQKMLQNVGVSQFGNQFRY